VKRYDAPVELEHALRHVEGCAAALRHGDLVLALAHAKDGRSDLFYVVKELAAALDTATA
jgi:hypothetical protein